MSALSMSISPMSMRDPVWDTGWVLSSSPISRYMNPVDWLSRVILSKNRARRSKCRFCVHMIISFVKIYGIPEIREAKQNSLSYLFNAHNPEGTHRLNFPRNGLLSLLWSCFCMHREVWLVSGRSEQHTHSMYEGLKWWTLDLPRL